MQQLGARRGQPSALAGKLAASTTDGLRSYGAVMDKLGNREKQEIGALRQQSGRELTDEETGRCSAFGH